MRWLLLWSLISVAFFGPAFAQQAAPPPDPLPSASSPANSTSSASATSASTPSSASPSELVPRHYVEQYKAYAADVGSLGSQAATTHTFYLTIISGLIAVVALKRPNRRTEEYFGAVPILVFIVIALVCGTWWLTAHSFDRIFAAKFFVLRKMESEIPHLYPLFTMQSEQYKSGILIHQAWLIGVVGFGSLAIALLGIRWQIKNWSRHAIGQQPIARPARHKD